MSNEIVVTNAERQKIDVSNTEPQDIGLSNETVTSVNGQMGAVLLTQDDIPAGENFVPFSTEDKQKINEIYDFDERLPTAEDIERWNNKSDFSGSYNDLTDTPTIPTKVSELDNDKEYATEKFVNDALEDVDVDLTGYATEEFVQDAIANAELGGEADLSSYVKNTDYATESKAGIARIYGTGNPRNTTGVGLTGNNVLTVVPATKSNIDNRATETDIKKPITPDILDYAIKAGLSANKETWNAEDKEKARQLIDAVGTDDIATNTKAGLVKYHSQYGVQLIGGTLAPLGWDTYVTNRSNAFMTYANLDKVVKEGLTNPKPSFTETQKMQARYSLGIDKPNYDENDPNNPAYIENRPFYHSSDELTFDKTGSDVKAEWADSTPGYWKNYYRVSDEPITKDNVVGAVLYGTFSHSGSGGSYTRNIEESILDSDITECSGGFSAKGLFVVYDYEACATATRIQFTSNGVYLITAYSEGGDGGNTSEYTKIVFTNYEIQKLDNMYLDLPSNEDFKALEKEVETAMGIAKGAEHAESYDALATMVEVLNDLPDDAFTNNDNINIIAMNVPDFWVVRVEETPNRYEFKDNDELMEELVTNGTIQVGHYVLARRETGKIKLEDHPTYDDLDDYVKNSDYATGSTAGVIKVGAGLHLSASNPGSVYVEQATNPQIDLQSQKYCPITPNNLSYAVAVAVSGKKSTDNGKTYTYGNQISLSDTEKASAQKWLGLDGALYFFGTNGSMGLTYAIDGTSARCTGIGGVHNYGITDVVIGSKVNGVPVVKITSEGGGLIPSSVTSVEIPSTVTIIGESAFEMCSSLTSIIIPNSITSIFQYAFRFCDNLKDVYYTGSAEDWGNILISDTGNESLSNATIHYNYSKEG